jgi:mono/diheme cytochrome c family protein
MTMPSRQGLEQIAIVLAVGAAIFALVALWRWRRGRTWQRFVTSSGILGVLILVSLSLAYTVAPNIPTPYVPLTARFQQNPLPDTPETVAAGKQVFLAHCAICHGVGALGDGPAAATLIPRPVNLRVHVPQHAPGELHYWISEGIAGTAMPSWKGELSETQRWQVIRFLQALAAGRVSSP